MTTETVPKSKRNRNLAIGCGGLIVLLLLCGVIAQLGGGTSTKTTNTGGGTTGASRQVEQPAQAPKDTTKEAPKEAAQPTPLPGVGVPVAVGKRVWVVDNVTDRGQTIASGNQFIADATTSGKFIEVAATVQNQGDDEFMIMTPKLEDAQGREFDSSSNVLFIIPTERQCILESLNPGLTKSCTWVYEVPADATDLKFMAGGALFDSAVPIDLGL